MSDPSSPTLTSDAPLGRSRFAYIPGLDGMRGIWVLLGPLLYHARPDVVPGGILALDLFFVLSAFLITSLALNEWEATGRIDLLGYAGRRARRLFPALLLALGALTLYLIVWGDPEQYARWTGAIVATLTYSVNWYEAYSGVSYFEQFANPSPLVHVWSFAIEEQFYLFAPFFLIASLKLFRSRAYVAIALISAMAALGSAAWMSHLYQGGDPSRVYYGTDTRAMAFFVGIGLAVLHRRLGAPRTGSLSRRLAVVGTYLASAFYLWAVFNIDHNQAWMFNNGGFLLMAVAAAIIVHGVVIGSTGPLHRFYEARPIRWMGRISYGLYLFHWPIYLLIITPDRLARSWLWVFAGLALTFAVATLSFYLLEQPFVQRRVPLKTSRRLQPWPAALAGAGAVVVILGGLLAVNANQPERVRQVLIAPATPQEQTPDSPRQQTGEDGPGTDPVPVGDARPTTPTSGHAADGEVVGHRGELRVMVVGDSVSTQIGEALRRWSERNPGRIVVFNHSHLGCVVTRHGEKRVPGGGEGPVGDVCSGWNDPVEPGELNEPGVISWPTAVEVFRPDVVLAHITPWDVTDRRVPELGDHWTHVGNPDFDDYARREYRLASEVLTSTGAELIWLDGAHLNREITPQNHPDRIDRLNLLVREAVFAMPRVFFADFPAFIGPVGSDRELAIRGDGVHLSRQGFLEVAEWLTDDILGLDRAPEDPRR